MFSKNDSYVIKLFKTLSSQDEKLHLLKKASGRKYAATCFRHASRLY
jgi:hypothetical protein